MTGLFETLAPLIAANEGEVPRSVMPQINEADYPALFDWLRAQGVTITRETVDASRLCQRQLVDPAEEPTNPDVLAKPLLVSSDGCVLDGNHRAAAHRRDGTPAPADVLDRPFEEAFDLLCAFAKTYTLGSEPGREHSF